MTIKKSLSIAGALFTYLLSNPLSARVTVIDYVCADGKTLTVSYFFGHTTINATTVFEGNPHKMYYDPASTPAVMVFREEPYILHIENKNDISKAVIINITKESQGETLHDSALYKHCVPE